MPSKIARKLTAAQTQRAIAKTKDHVLAQPSQVDDVQQAIANTQRVGLSQVSQDDVVQPDEETQLEHDLRQAIAESQRVRLSQTSQEDDDQPDQETQVDDDTQPDADDPTSSADSSIVDDAMASTADGADATTPDTPASSTHEVETKPATKKPAAKKVAGKKIPATDDKKDGEVTKKKRRVKRDPTNFSAYIHKVNKEVNPEGGMSKAAMQIMNDFIKDICIRIADLASDLCKKLKKATLQAHDIQAATKLILSGELAKHAQSDGAKALRAFNKATEKDLR